MRLVRCDDPYTKLLPGTEGTVRFVTVHVAGDNGSRLGLCPDGGDRFEVIG